MRGWLGSIKRQRTIWGEIGAYKSLAELFDFVRAFKVVSLDEQAADHFDRLRKQKVRIGSMDLKIAAIALAHDALLLTANTRDFGQVPGLRFANWLDEASPGG
jgi:tRNA(fMet)-specific endonuclease VapC